MKRVALVALLLAAGVGLSGQSVADLVVSKELRSGTLSWSLVVPASRGSSLAIKVPITISEWDGGTKVLTIEPTDTGGSLGVATYTSLMVDKSTGVTLDYVNFNLVFGIEREAFFPVERKPGRTYMIGGERFRQVLMNSPLEVFITVNEPTSYGLEVTIGDKTQIAAIAPLLDSNRIPHDLIRVGP
jgi:hypothetical protein